MNLPASWPASVVVALLAASAGCGREEGAPPTPAAAPPPAVRAPRPATPAPHPAPPPAEAVALRVGAHAFSPRDMDDALRYTRWKYGDSGSAEVGAYARLIEGYLAAEILARLGKPIAEKDLDAEVARIDRNTLMPDRLKELKDLFGGETTRGYRDLAILPDFANRRFFFEVFPQADDIHRERREKAEAVRRALAAAGPSADFEAVAAEDPLWRFERALFSPARGFYRAEEEDRAPAPVGADVPAEVARAAAPEPDRPSARYEQEVFADLPAGEVCRRVVPLRDGYLLLRWTGWKDEGGKVRRIERLYLPKRDAHDYFYEQAKGIRVFVADPAIAQRLKNQVSWVREIDLEAPVGPAR